MLAMHPTMASVSGSSKTLLDLPRSVPRNNPLLEDFSSARACQCVPLSSLVMHLINVLDEIEQTRRWVNDSVNDSSVSRCWMRSLVYSTSIIICYDML